MPKMKTHRGAKKRITKIIKNGKIKRARAVRSHILNKMTTKRKRNLRKGALVKKVDVYHVKRLLVVA